jgi:signal transduction histidine kinase
VLEDVSDLLAGRARDKNIDLVCRPDPSFHRFVGGDPDRFRRILNNLLGNAIKFTDRGEVFVDMRLRVE